MCSVYSIPRRDQIFFSDHTKPKVPTFGDLGAMDDWVVLEEIVGDRIERDGDGGENIARRDRLDKKLK